MADIAVIYTSVHHKNTKKLLEGIANNCEIDLFDVSQAKQQDLSQYHAIGFASGIYMSRFHESMVAFLDECSDLPKKSFIIYTSGSGNKKYAVDFCKKLSEMKIQVLGIYQCKGYDTYGPLKLIGGIAKGHPNKADISAGTSFIKSTIMQKL